MSKTMKTKSKTTKTNKGAWRLPALAAGLTLSTAASALAAPAAPAHDFGPPRAGRP